MCQEGNNWFCWFGWSRLVVASTLDYHRRRNSKIVCQIICARSQSRHRPRSIAARVSPAMSKQRPAATPGDVHALAASRRWQTLARTCNCWQLYQTCAGEVQRRSSRDVEGFRQSFVQSLSQPSIMSRLPLFPVLFSSCSIFHWVFWFLLFL